MSLEGYNDMRLEWGGKLERRGKGFGYVLDLIGDSKNVQSRISIVQLNTTYLLAEFDFLK